MNTISYKISLNCGDLISCLPGIRQLYREKGKKAIIYQTIGREVEHPSGTRHPVNNEDGNAVTMNIETFRMMKPLLEYQEYIESYEIYEGQSIDFDLDKPREYNLSLIPYAPLYYYPSMIYPEMICNLSESWIETDYEAGFQNKVIINRTERYNNPHLTFFFLKEFEKDLIFAGTPDEHNMFCERWKLNIPALSVTNFLGLATAINFCKFFLGNQSFCWHLANAIGAPRILEVCQQYPNSFPTTANGYPFLFQKALQYYFNKLYNQ